jgi:hypothetical protein
VEHVIYECGICDCLHPWDWDGDCREDANRFGAPEDYAERRGVDINDVEVRSWDDRMESDNTEDDARADALRDAQRLD